ncbi:hypothetical protein PLESTF_000848300 [Pleodorina starrii]|nr:hypothetical protein PLESTM_001875600 [Pleodorina starrii]GLC69567.1 hypothetical protein PLESTF_000848300 [Pleodorina starrii]
MGCGASKGAEPTSSSAMSFPPAPKPEFTPENKPRPTTDPEEMAYAKESARPADQIVMSDVMKFEEETDSNEEETGAKQGKVAEAESVPLTVTSVLPPPPATPPAAATKPLFQTANTTSNFGDAPAESADVSYFPPQVSLQVGGGDGGYFAQQQQQQQQSLEVPALQTSLQPFDLTPAPSAPAAALPPPAPAPMFVSMASSRQLQPLPQPLSQQRQQEPQEAPDAEQQQPRELQQQRSTRLPPLQTQPQPLTESGPGPSSTSAAQPSADPWSSLQSTYRIQEPRVGGKSDSTRSRVGAGGSRGAGAGREVLVLGDDDDDFGGGGGGGLNSTANSAMNRTSGYGAGRTPVSLPPPQFGSGPKKGGWGSGAMAQAGELMLGEDDWLVKDRPPGGSGSAGLPPQPPLRQPQEQQAAVMAYNSRARMLAEEEDRHAPVALKGPAPAAKGKAEDDVLCEDVEDVDTLLEDEMERQGLSNKSLASKLAAYEAQFRDEDD